MMSEQAARTLLERHLNGGVVPPRVQHGGRFWLFTYDHSVGWPAPLGAPSWLVTADGRCLPVTGRELPSDVLDREDPGWCD